MINDEILVFLVEEIGGDWIADVVFCIYTFLSGMKMDGLIIEINHVSCYDMIEQFCEYIGKQLNSLQKPR